MGTEETGQIATGEAAAALADELLSPGEVILAPLDIPIEETRWITFADGFSDHAPAYPTPFVPDGSWQQAVAADLTPAFVVGKAERVAAGGDDGRDDDRRAGPFVVRRLGLDWGPGEAYGVARILRLPESS